MTSSEAVTKAIEIVGGIAKLAAARGLRAPTVHEWKTGERKVPLDHCPYIEGLTAGQVTCEMLRPDKADYFALIRSLPPKNPPQVSATIDVGAINTAARGVAHG